MEERFVARRSLPATFLFFLVGIGMAAVALLTPQTFGLNPKSYWEVIRLPTLVIGLIIAAFFGKSFFDGSEQIVVDDQGIRLRHWSDDLIPWSAITRGRVARQYSSAFFYTRWLAFDLNSPERYQARSLRGRLFGRGWNMGMGDIVFSASGLDRNFDELVEAIRDHAPPDFELSVE